MLVYIIDGWNVVHQVPELKKDPMPRQALLRYIKSRGLSGSRTNKVCVVFDGFFDLREALEEKEYQVIFSGEKSADQVIIEKLGRFKNKSEVVVVTDDRHIRIAARMQGARCRKVAEFIRPKQRAAPGEEGKSFGTSLEKEITEEMRKVWLNDTEAT